MVADFPRGDVPEAVLNEHTRPVEQDDLVAPMPDSLWTQTPGREADEADVLDQVRSEPLDEEHWPNTDE